MDDKTQDPQNEKIPIHPAPITSTNVWAPDNELDVSEISTVFQKLHNECQKLLIGQSEIIELMFICILCDGHILLEGVPGIAKTLSVKVMSKALDTEFKRIQFTPDLLPSDIIGTSIYHMKEGVFQFSKGPIFSNLVLIDEINRAPAKTQSALFEVMEEKQITYDGIQYDMSFPFVVMATQNPIEQEGTYRLPEAQLDRFLMKINLQYPTLSDELEILKRFKTDPVSRDLSIIQKALTPRKIKKLKKLIQNVHVSEEMLRYITQLIQATRNHAKIYLGGSPRASLALLSTSKVAATLMGRGFVVPDDIQSMAPHILNHRLNLTPDAEMEGMSTMLVIEDIIKTIEVPR